MPMFCACSQILHSKIIVHIKDINTYVLTIFTNLTEKNNSSYKLSVNISILTKFSPQKFPELVISKVTINLINDFTSQKVKKIHFYFLYDL